MNALVLVEPAELERLVTKALRAVMETSEYRTAAIAAPPTQQQSLALALEATFETAQLAEHFHTDQSTVALWFRSGRLEGSKATGKWLASASQVSAFEAKRRAAEQRTPPQVDEEAARLLQRMRK